MPEVCLDSASDITVSAEHLQRNNKIAAPILKTLVFLRLWVVKLYTNMTKNKLKFITKCKIINIISHYTPGIYAAGYIVFALTFVRSSVRMFVRSFVRSFVRVFVRSLLSVTFVEFTSKFLVKVSLSEYISLTTHQKAFIFEPWVPERVSFYTMSFCPRVDAPGWG